MGFYEDDRIIRKNKRFNFPTPEINQKAREVIFSIGLPNSEALLEALQDRLNSNDDPETRKVLETAIIITRTE
jgi:hypothetical protein